MTVEIMRYNKKKNSTATPPFGINKLLFECVLKEPTDILSPIIEIEVESIGVYISYDYNFAYVPFFHRYYYITNMTIRNASGERGIITLQLSVDALSSNVAAIRAATGFVVRSESFPNMDIIDKTYPAMCGNTMVGNALSGETFGFTYDAGVWALGFVGNNGVTKTLLTSRQGVDNIFNVLYGDTGYSQIDPAVLTAGVTRLLLNPGQYITSVRWFPIFPGRAWVGNLEEFYIGWWDTGWRDLDIAQTGNTFNLSYTAAIPKHPQSNTNNRMYLNAEPHSKYFLYFPPFGTIPVDSMYLYNKTGISCELTIDYLSGQASLAINGLPQVYTADMGVNFNVQATTGDKSGASSLMALAPAAVEAASEVASVAASIPKDINRGMLNFLDQLAGYKLYGGDADAISGATPVPQTAEAVADTEPVETQEFGSKVKNSLQSAIAAYQSNVFVGVGSKSPNIYQYAPTLYAVFTSVTESAPSIYGYPCNQQLSLAGLSGFTSVDKPQIQGAYTIRERSIIEKALSEGVYLE